MSDSGPERGSFLSVFEAWKQERMFMCHQTVPSILGGLGRLISKLHVVTGRAAKQSPQRRLLISLVVFLCMGSTGLIKVISGVGFWWHKHILVKCGCLFKQQNSILPTYILVCMKPLSLWQLDCCRGRNRQVRVHTPCSSPLPGLRQAVGLSWVDILCI